jgi:hypothetical protein
VATKKELKVGDRVEYRRTHDKAVRLIGTISAIHDKDDLVEIEREVDGRIVEVEGTDHAHASDVNVIEKAKPKAAAPTK